MSSDPMRGRLAELSELRSRIAQGGGPDEIDRQHRAGKLTARERVHRLLDPGTFQELDIWGTPLDMGTLVDYRKGAADAVAVGYGEVNRRPIYVWAQDATVLGGTLATMHARKITMVMQKAIQAGVPIVVPVLVYFVPSSGLARPKSIIRGRPFESSMMFEGLTSRWMTPAW